MKLILTALNCSDSGLVVPYHCAGLRVLTGTPRQNWRLGARQRLRITLLQTNVNVVHKTNSLKFTNACWLVWLGHTNLRAWGHTEATVCTDLRFLLLCIAPFWTLFCTISPCRKHKVSLSFICLSALQPGTRPMTTSKLKNGSYTGCSEVFIFALFTTNSFTVSSCVSSSHNNLQIWRKWSRYWWFCLLSNVTSSWFTSHISRLPRVPAAQQ